MSSPAFEMIQARAGTRTSFSLSRILLVFLILVDNINTSKTSKPYAISFQHRPEYLYVYVSGGEDSYEISRQYWLEVAEECRKTNYKKVLIEEDISMIIPMTDVYRLASEIPNMGCFGHSPRLRGPFRRASRIERVR